MPAVSVSASTAMPTEEISEQTPRLIWRFDRTSMDDTSLMNVKVKLACAENTKYDSGFEIIGYDSLTLTVRSSIYKSVKLISVDDYSITSNNQSMSFEFTFQLLDASGYWGQNQTSSVTVYL